MPGSFNTNVEVLQAGIKSLINNFSEMELLLNQTLNLEHCNTSNFMNNLGLR